MKRVWRHSPMLKGDGLFLSGSIFCTNINNNSYFRRSPKHRFIHIYTQPQLHAHFHIHKKKHNDKNKDINHNSLINNSYKAITKKHDWLFEIRHSYILHLLAFALTKKKNNKEMHFIYTAKENIFLHPDSYAVTYKINSESHHLAKTFV